MCIRYLSRTPRLRRRDKETVQVPNAPVINVWLGSSFLEISFPPLPLIGVRGRCPLLLIGRYTRLCIHVSLRIRLTLAHCHATIIKNCLKCSSHNRSFLFSTNTRFFSDHVCSATSSANETHSLITVFHNKEEETG